MPNIDLLALIRIVQKRMKLISMLRMGMLGSIAGLGAASIVAVAGLLYPIHHYRIYAISLVGLGMLCGILWSIVKRPTLLLAAKMMDQGGLEERITTAFRRLEDTSVIAKLQREEAVQAANKYVLERRRHLPFRVSYRYYIGVLTGCLIVISLLLWPNAMDDLVAQKAEEQQWIEEQVSLLEEQVEEIRPSAERYREAHELNELIASLQEEMKSAELAAEALADMEETLKELDQLTKQWETKQQQANLTLAQLEHHEGLSGMAKGLQAADSEALEQALQQLQDEMPSMDEQTKQQLVETLNPLAELAAGLDKETQERLQEAMAHMSEQLARNGGDTEPLTEEQIQALAEALTEAMKQLDAQKQFAEMAAKMGAQLASNGLQMAQQLAAAQGAPIAGAWSNGSIAAAWSQQSGQSSGIPTGQSGSNGQSGAQSGGPNSNGQGSNGSNPGTGQGSGNGQGSGSGQGGLAGGFGDGSRNLVSTPRSMEGRGDIHSDQGPVNGGGGEIEMTGSSPMIDGASRPYEEVFVEYETEARRSLDRNTLPQNMQGLVRDYFTEIQPDR